MTGVVVGTGASGGHLVGLVAPDRDGRGDAVAHAAALDGVLLDRHHRANPFEVRPDALNAHVSSGGEAFQAHGAFENQHRNQRGVLGHRKPSARTWHWRAEF